MTITSEASPQTNESRWGAPGTCLPTGRRQRTGCRGQSTRGRGQGAGGRGQADNCPLGSAQTRLICEDL